MALCHRRQFRLGCMVDIILVLVVLALLASFSSRHGQLSKSERDADDSDFGVRDLVECLPSNNIRRMRETISKDGSSWTDHLSRRGDARVGNDTPSNGVHIDQRLRVIKDSRPPLCRKLSYDTLEKVTLIIHFNDYQFNDLKNTMGSILLHSNMDLVEEILVIDDASSLDHIVQDAIRYFRRIPKARYLRHRENEPAGTARVRTIAAKEARANIVVFLDWWTICNRGWLEPLIDMLAKDHNAIAVPHFDKIHDPVSLDYVKSTENQIAALSWNLAIRVQAAPAEAGAPTHGFHHTPAIRGNVFAVRKEFFFSIGAYDTDLDGDGGGEHAELSVRAWLCTGSVKVVPCSRVGLLNVKDPVKVSSSRNVRRIAELWFAKRKTTVLRSSGLSGRSTSADIGDVSERRNSIPLINQCKDIDWYLTNIATNMVAPSSDAIRFGILRVKTDRCSRLIPAFERIKLDDCKPEHFTQHRQEMLFELTKDGLLKVMGKCMTTKDNAYLLAEKCRPGDTKQQWKYIDEQLVNVWCNFCAMHVTDPDSRMEGDRQIAMAQECNADTSNGGLFKKWEFLLP